MAGKRKNGSDSGSEAGGITARERKKQKTALARTIAVQPVASASNASTNVVAGPFKSVRFDSMRGLPGSLDVERFTEARAFEINAMQDAMQNAKSAGTQRAWQQLPRHLRRRAASHDVRRVPLRLREKARAEMDPMRRKALGRSHPKLGKKKRVTRTKALLKRQRDKAWLETHLWHAKRMKMDNMWGYRLAIEPTEKSFRPSHRASVHGSILHDASYFALLELTGPEKVLRAVFDSCCDFQAPSPGAKRFLTGARVCETHIYKYAAYPFDLIAPITVIWRSVETRSAVVASSTIQQSSSKQGSKSKSKGKGKEPVNGSQSLDQSPVRSVWVRCHPSVTAEVNETLLLATSFALQAAKKAGPTEELDVEIVDMREQVNIFEIMGPKSSQVIKGALKPVDKDRPEFVQFWQSLNRLQTVGSVPRGMIVGFTVQDPRLSFPPKNQKLEIQTKPSPSTNIFPSAALASSDIWVDGTRARLRKPRYQKRDIDQRKANNLVPGTPLQPTQKDDRIPVLLIQRSVEAPVSNAANSSQSSSPSLHGWTLIVPAGWGMPFFSSLTYTGSRVGGQRERQTQAYEGGCPYFPRDYPFTSAYDDFAESREDEERDKWGRKPPAKRINYEKLGTRSPWIPDWEVVLGLQEPEPEESEFIDTQRDADDCDLDADDIPPDVQAATAVTKSARPWLFRGTDILTAVQTMASMFIPGAGLLDHINKVRAKRSQDPLPQTVRPDDLWQGALVMVRVVLLGRGNPQDLALIYSVSDEEARKWYLAEAMRSQGAAAMLEDAKDETELSQVTPKPEAIIGYVTTGHYSLSRGEGHAIGAVPLSRFVCLKQQAERLHAGSSLLVKIRDRGENICRAAHLELTG